MKYPTDRMWELIYKDNARDYNSILYTRISAGIGDRMEASGAYDAILSDAVKTNRNDYDNLNRQIRDYIDVPMDDADVSINVKPFQEPNHAYRDSTDYTAQITTNDISNDMKDSSITSRRRSGLKSYLLAIATIFAPSFVFVKKIFHRYREKINKMTLVYRGYFKSWVFDFLFS